MTIHWKHLLAAGLVVLSLGACGSDSDDKDKPDMQDDKQAEHHQADALPKKEILPICPQVAIVRTLDVLRDYGGEKPDPSELVFSATMLGVDGECEYTDTGVDMTYTLSLAAERGPRLGGKTMGAPYFVALVAPDGKIISKDRMTATFSFDGNRVADVAEPLHVFLPLPKDKRDTGPNYQVLMGFQLTDEQLKDAKKQP